MNGFFWASGYLGWAFFALVVFTGLCWLLADLSWRLTSIKIGRFALAALTVWAIGLAAIWVIFTVVDSVS